MAASGADGGSPGAVQDPDGGGTGMHEFLFESDRDRAVCLRARAGDIREAVGGMRCGGHFGPWSVTAVAEGETRFGRCIIGRDGYDLQWIRVERS